MKKSFTLIAFLLLCMAWSYAAGIDMQIHWGTKEAQLKSLSTAGKQKNYYTGDYTPEALRALSGDELFGALNTLMGNTCKLSESGFNYDALRYAYVNVDKDLNHTGNIIGYYDGQSMNGTWDAGKTYNREHTWPQSKGADKSTPMGYDMQSVRPASAAINSERGSTAYGESKNYYDPNVIAINNSLYAPEHVGSYRGDCARVILYDYVVYGSAGGHSNKYYLGNAQLLSKLGKNGVFESIAILLKWHMQDPSSLTEMVRNDGAQTYQGNRNPFIDYPELAIQMLKNAGNITTYEVTVNGSTMMPAYSLTLADGFIAYMGTKTSRPAEITVTGAQYSYDNTSGRLTISKVTGPVTITASTPEAIEMTEDGTQAFKIIHNGQIVIIKNGKAYTPYGALVGDIR